MSSKTSIHNSEHKNKVDEIKYKGVRRRRWGKWVSEIRVPGTSTRLWLGSYAAPEAAAVAHDTAVFFLRGPGPLPASSMNFPWRIEGAYMWAPLSPGSVQRVASDAGMTADAQLTEELWRLDKQEINRLSEKVLEEERGRSESSDQEFGLHELNIYDMEICYV